MSCNQGKGLGSFTITIFGGVSKTAIFVFPGVVKLSVKDRHGNKARWEGCRAAYIELFFGPFYPPPRNKF